jgi:phage baseplate assembly protein W
VSTILSDYNETRSSNISRTDLYTDIPNNFAVHPVIKDIFPIKDLDSVKQSLKNLILGTANSRLFQPEINSGIYELLFENVDSFTAYELQVKIRNVIKKYEPRIDVFEVSVSDNSDENSYRINIKFNVSYDKTEEIIFYLNRIR